MSTGALEPDNSTAARLVKRLPGFTRWRTPVLGWLRRNRIVRWMVKRLVPPSMRRAVTAPPGLTGGRVLMGENQDAVPVVVLLCLGWAEEPFARAVEEIARVQLLSGRFRPVFCVDRPVFEPIRREEYIFESVLSREDWAAMADPVDWTDYLQSRVGAMARDYGAMSVVPLAPTDGTVADLVLQACEVSPRW